MFLLWHLVVLLLSVSFHPSVLLLFFPPACVSIQFPHPCISQFTVRNHIPHTLHILASHFLHLAPSSEDLPLPSTTSLALGIWFCFFYSVGVKFLDPSLSFLHPFSDVCLFSFLPHHEYSARSEYSTVALAHTHLTATASRSSLYSSIFSLPGLAIISCSQRTMHVVLYNNVFLCSIANRSLHSLFFSVLSAGACSFEYRLIALRS